MYQLILVFLFQIWQILYQLNIRIKNFAEFGSKRSSASKIYKRFTINILYSIIKINNYYFIIKKQGSQHWTKQLIFGLMILLGVIQN